MKQTLRRYLILPAIALVAASAARGQFLTPFTAKAGIPTAASKARDSVGTDAQLAFIATFGHLSQSGLTLEFNLDNGDADGWGYTFFSPSQSKSATLGVVKLPVLGFQTQSLGSGLPVPSQLNLALDTAGAYSNSDQMIARLKQDTTFSRYRTELPNAKPQFITFGQLFTADSVNLPNGFPLDQPTWTMLFTGGGDSSMTCFVASKTGEHFCRRVTLPSSGVSADGRAAGTAALDVLPNPTTGRARIDITLPSGVRTGSGTTLMLFDMRGAAVMDLSAELARNNFAFAEFDATQLTAGVYYCRVSGDNWNGTIGVIVQK
ncbi:MAG: T9SS type A sorting domain-containing protein [Bacteroidetes bacterium]|nr:T9SS type A sorting domain-containing protein [Bacteroidota bacterium]